MKVMGLVMVVVIVIRLMVVMMMMMCVCVIFVLSVVVQLLFSCSVCRLCLCVSSILLKISSDKRIGMVCVSCVLLMLLVSQCMVFCRFYVGVFSRIYEIRFFSIVDMLMFIRISCVFVMLLCYDSVQIVSVMFSFVSMVKIDMIGLFSFSMMMVKIVVVLVLELMLMMLGLVSGLCSMIWKVVLLSLKFRLVSIDMIVCGSCNWLMVKDVFVILWFNSMCSILLGGVKDCFSIRVSVKVMISSVSRYSIIWWWWVLWCCWLLVMI